MRLGLKRMWIRTIVTTQLPMRLRETWELSGALLAQRKALLVNQLRMKFAIGLRAG